MSPFRILLSAISSTLIVTSCASQPEPPVTPPDFFHTNISVEGAKRFSFSIAVMAGNKGKDSRVKLNGGPMPQMGKTPPDGKGPHTDPTSKLYEHLEAKLSETGYCREGYTEIDTYQTEGRLNLIGECNETATEQDRVFFVNRYGY